MVLRSRIACAAILLGLLASRPAAAYRPFDSTDADVAEFGHLELEIGPIGYLSVGSAQYLTLPQAVINYGFAHGWEAVFETDHWLQLLPDHGTESSLQETMFTLKHVLRPGVLQDKPGVSIATEFGLLLPDWNSEPGGGLWAAMIISWRISEVTMHLNIAFQVTRELQPGTQDGLIIEGPGRWPVRPVVELLGEYDGGPYWQASALAGGIWQISELFAIDCAFRAGDSSEGIIKEVRAGFTWSIPVGPKEAGTH